MNPLISCSESTMGSKRTTWYFLPVRACSKVAASAPACVFRGVRKLFGIHPENRCAAFGRKHHDTIGARLIPKPLPRRQKNKGQDKPDHQVVLPAGAWIIPEQKALHRAHWTSHVHFSLTCVPAISVFSNVSECNQKLETVTYIFAGPLARGLGSGPSPRPPGWAASKRWPAANGRGLPAHDTGA